MKETEKSVFEEHYRVVAVERNRLLVRGILSGEVLTIINPEPTLTKESLSARYTQLLLRVGRLDCSMLGDGISRSRGQRGGVSLRLRGDAGGGRTAWESLDGAIR